MLRLSLRQTGWQKLTENENKNSKRSSNSKGWGGGGGGKKGTVAQWCRHTYMYSQTQTQRKIDQWMYVLYFIISFIVPFIYIWNVQAWLRCRAKRHLAGAPWWMSSWGVMWGSTTEAGAYQGHNFVTVVSSHNWPRGIFTYHDLTLTRVRLWFGWFLQNETRDKRTGTGHPRCSCWSLIAQGQGVTWNYIHLCA